MDFLKHLNELKVQYTEQKTRKTLVKENKKKTGERILELKNKTIDADLAVIIIKEYMTTVTDEVTQLFENTITSGLQEIFDDSYVFSIKVHSQKNRNTCQFMILTSEYEEPIDMEFTQGTCLKQMVSVLCRMIIVCLDSRLCKTIILDEPFSGVDEERMPTIAEFLKKVIKEFKLQMIIVTHDSDLEMIADNVINL